MKTCSCGNVVDPRKEPSLGIEQGMDFVNCPKCGSTLVFKTPEYPKIMAVLRARRIMATLKGDEDENAK